MKCIVLAIVAALCLQSAAFSQSDVDKFFKNAAKVQKDKAVADDEKPAELPKKEAVKPSPVKEVQKPTKPISKPQGVRIQSPHPNIVVKWVRTNRINNRVTIDFTLTNTAVKDVEISLYGGYFNSSAFDNEGNKYDKSFTNAISSEKHTLSESRYLFPSNVPLKCQIVIDEVEPEATSFARINWNLYCSKLDVHNKPIIISNVSIIDKEE